MSTDGRCTAFSIARLAATDAADFRDIRLTGLREHAEAFGASWEEEARQSEAQFAARLDGAVVFGARATGSTRLEGVVGLYLPEAAKFKHKAVMWGMFVRYQSRKSGIGSELLSSAIAYAADAVEEINLTVGVSNNLALRLYRFAGFRRYGLERRALKIGDQYYDEALMSLILQKY